MWQYFLCVRVRCVEHFLQALRPDFLRRFLKASTFASFAFLKRALLQALRPDFLRRFLKASTFASFCFFCVLKASTFASFLFFCVPGSPKCVSALRKASTLAYAHKPRCTTSSCPRGIDCDQIAIGEFANCCLGRALPRQSFLCLPRQSFSSRTR